MQISFTCPGCETLLEAEGPAAGSQVTCPQCDTALTVPSANPGPGVTVGGFRIKSLLGKGGMGLVFLSRQESVDRDVALKVLHPQLTVDNESVERFLQEGRLAARLDHANVVTTYEAGKDEGVYYMAMAFVDGETLDKKVSRDGPMPEKEALAITAAMASALAYAWDEHQMLHRDVKPSNILIDRHGAPKLADLGLSKRLGETGDVTMAGYLIGTPNYMSPEQIDGGEQIDCRSDIYSLGATLYNLLTGCVPFAGNSAVESMTNKVSAQLDDPRKINPAISDACVALLSAMLAKSPSHRYADWHAVAKDIERVLAGQAPLVSAVPPDGSSLSVSSAPHTLHREPSSRIVIRQHDPALASKKKMAVVESATPGKGRGRPVLRTVVALCVVLVVAAGVGFSVSVVKKGREKQRGVVARMKSLEVELATVMAYAEQNKDDPGEAARRLKAFQQEAVGTRFEAQASAKLEALASARQQEQQEQQEQADRQAIAETLSTLTAQAVRLLNQGQRDQAVALLSGYDGVWADATDAGRRAAAADLAKRAQAIESEARLAAQQKEAQLKDLDRDIVAALLKTDVVTAQQAYAAAQADGVLVDAAASWQAVGTMLRELIHLPGIVMASFKADIGKECSVVLKDGPRNLKILAIEGGQVSGEKLVQVQGRKVGAGTVTFGFDDLSPQEKFRRLGSEETPALDLMRGLLACEASALDTAGKYLDRAACPIAAMIAVELRSAPTEAVGEGKPDVTQPPSADAQTDDGAALAAFLDLLEVAGLPKRDLSDEELTRAITTRALTMSDVSAIRRATADFRSQHRNSDVARNHESVLQWFSKVQPSGSSDGSADIDITVLKQKSTGMSGTDYDNKRQSFQILAKIKNSERSLAFEKLKGTLYTFGEAVTIREYVLLDKASVNFDLPTKGDFEFSGRTISLEFDDNRYAQFGTKYYGYLVVIEDADGRTIAEKTSRVSFVKYLEKYKDARPGTRLSRQFDKIERRFGGQFGRRNF